MISQLWAEQGGASSTLNYFEFPLILIFCIILYFSPKGNDRAFTIHTLTPSCTIIGLYIIYDIFYMYLARSPRLSDFGNMLLMLKVSIPLFVVMLVLFFVAFSPLFYSLYCWGRRVEIRSGVFVLGLKATALTLVLLAISSQEMFIYQQNKLPFVSWSDTRNVIKNGRTASFIYYHNKRKEMLNNLGKQQAISIDTLFYSQKPEAKRNIHIIIFESFIDPRKIKNLSFNKSPLGESLRGYLDSNQEFSHIETTVYGGGSPQSEFEILTGIPALAQLGSIEFNLFEGTKNSSLINALRKEGYYTVVSKGSKSGFYNSSVAYNGIGFDELHYLDKKPYYAKSPGDDHIFDGDLLKANLEYVRSYLSADNAKPLVNYVVGMYGHMPFDRNTTLRPDEISVSASNTLMKDLANQFYYRTDALGRYLDGLKKIDPEAIVLICSDHLPPILSRKIQYSLEKKTINIGLLLNRFVSINIDGKRYYEIPHMIWGLLGDSRQDINVPDPFKKMDKEKIYLAYLSEAMGVYAHDTEE